MAEKSRQRILSVDVLRGLTVALMILVNNGYGESFVQLGHSSWNGLLRDFYLLRWQAFFDAEDRAPGSGTVIDWYALEAPWGLQTQTYPAEAIGDPVEVAGEVFQSLFNE
jgi:hypothetical protein